jgi:hypothetical protein
MKKFLLSIVTTLCVAQSFSQSLGNETCATAVTVPTNGTCITGNNIGADAIGDGTASCFSVENGIWFKFVAPQMGPVVITNNDPGTNFNTQLALFTGTCGALTEVVCENDNGVAAGKATINSPCIIPGQTYYVLLDGYAGATGTFCIKITSGNRPSNDDCQCPIPLPTDGSCVNGTTLNATNQWGSLVGCQSAASNVEVWFTFTATQTGMTFNLSAGASGPLTGVGEIVVARGTSCGTIQSPLTGSSCGPLPLNYTVSGLVVGAQYYVTISNPPANSGSFVLCGTSVIPPVVPGQDCPTASVLCTTSPISQPTSNGGYGIQEVNTTNSCWGTLGGVGQGERQSRWYKFTVGCTGPLTFHIDPVNNNDDYDWAIWNITTLGCPTLATPSQTSVACNWQGIGGAPNGSTGMTSSPSTACSTLGAVDYTADPSCDPYAFVNTAAGGGSSTYTPYTATAGQTFALLIDNFTATNNGFTLTWGPGVIIGPDPQFTITNPACTRGITVTKSCATTNSNLVWDYGDGSTLSTTSSANQTHTYAADGTYNVTLTITDALGCVKTFTRSVIITTPPPAPTAAGTTICSGTTATLTATAPGGLYQWYTASTGGTLLGSEESFTTPVLTSNTTYYVQTTINGCTSPRTAVSVVINPIATANANVDQTICANSTVTLAGAIGGSATTGTWSGGTGTFAPNATTLNATYTPSVADISAGTVTLTLTSNDPAGPCPAATDQMVITINAVAIANANVDRIICAGSTVTLTGSIGGSATTGTWSGGSGTFAPNATTLNATYTPSAAEVTAGTVTLTLTSNDPAGPCPAASDQMMITINPAATANANVDQAICSNSTVTLAGSVGGSASTGTWSGGSGTFSPSAATLNGVYTPGAADISAGTVTLTLTSNDPAGPCPAATDQMVITINPVATANANIDQTICSGSTVTLAGAVGGSATTGTWSGGTGTYAPNASTLNAVYTPSAAERTAGTVTLTLTSNI